jgi:hypothetical protein
MCYNDSKGEPMSFIQKLIDLVVDNGLRKWSIMFLLIAIAVLFKLTDELNGVEFVSLLKGSAIAFFGANSIEYIGKRWAKKEDMSED